jgi:alpha-tubulin suppressor-like RCC1 family protein
VDPVTGILAGAATAVGTFNVTLSATNVYGSYTREVPFHVTGTPEATQLPPSILQVPQIAEYDHIGSLFTASGLPIGLEIDPATGDLSGTPKTGIYQALLSISNPYGSITVPWTVEVFALAAWGYNGQGQSTIPTGLRHVVAIAGGESHSVALRDDGTVTAWGENSAGQSTVPAGLSDVVAIAAGASHSLALQSDGTVKAWGSNFYGETTVPAGLSNVAAIVARGSLSLALKRDGTVKAWGANGQIIVPSGLTGVVAIAAGASGWLALKSDGTVVTRSETDYPIPTGLSRVVSITAGSTHALALKSDGTVEAWGSNLYGETTVPAGLDGVVTIAATYGRSLALRYDGTVVSWGRNEFGEGLVPTELTNVIALAAGDSHSLALVGPAESAPIISSPTLITEATGARSTAAFFHQHIIASGSPTSFSATGLPPGITLDPVKGVLTGRATAVGTFSVTLSATNSFGTNTRQVPFHVLGSPTLMQLPSDVLSPFTQSIDWGYVGAHFSASGLPSGLTLDPVTGTLGGTPKPGVYQALLSISNPYGSITVPWNVKVMPYAAWGAMSAPSGLTHVVAFAAQGGHSLALKSDGSVVGWGSNDFGESNVPPELGEVVAIAAGPSHSLALKRDGTIAAWGGSLPRHIVIPSGLSGVVAIAAGAVHSLALKSDGTVIAWGDNNADQRIVPTGLSGVVAIAAGGSQSLALKSDGTVIGWGATASPPSGLTEVVAIAMGDFHALALKSDGTVVAWGGNNLSQSTVPSGLTEVVAITAGDQNSLALRRDGSVIAWGSNSFGESTVPTGLRGVIAIAAGQHHSLALIRDEGTPTIVSPFQLVTEAAGVRSTLPFFRQRILASGSPTSFSATGLPPGITLDPLSGKLAGIATTVGTFAVTLSATNAFGTGSRQVPFHISGSPAVVQLPPAVLQPYDQVIDWGKFGSSFSAIGLPIGLEMDPITGMLHGSPEIGFYNSLLSLSNAFGTTSVPWPIEVTPLASWGSRNIVPAGLHRAIALAAGSNHSLALKDDGTVAAWGSNYYSQTTVPHGLSGVIAIAAGINHSLALKSDGTVIAWGTNIDGQSTVPAGLNGVIALAAGAAHSLAVKNDGTVVAWGSNRYLQTTPPAGLTNVVAIAAGGYHSLALKGDGSVVAWGYNGFGQRSVPSGLSEVISIAGGYSHSLALKNDGTVVAWGATSSGESLVPIELNDVVAIAAGTRHSIALKSDGSLVTWGGNVYGQSTVPLGLNGAVTIAAGSYHSMAMADHSAAYPLSWKISGTEATPLSQRVDYPRALGIYSATGLAPGLSINARSGVVSGSPTTAGLYMGKVQVSSTIRAHTFPLTTYIHPTSAASRARYDAWQAAQWSTGAPLSAPGDDADGDGVANLVELGLGTSPLIPTGDVPLVVEQISASAGEAFSLTVDVPTKSLQSVGYAVRFSNDLRFGPEAVSVTTFDALPEAAPGSIRLRFTIPAKTATQRFARLEVRLF